MENELIVAEKLNPVELFFGDGLESVLGNIAEQCRSYVFDIESKSGRKDCASLAYKIARSKTTIDDLGKKLLADQKAKIKQGDAQRKKARDFLENLKNEVRQPLTTWEQEQERIKEEEARKEIERVEKIEQAIAGIKLSDGMLSWASTTDEIQSMIKSVSEITVDEHGFQEFVETAKEVKNDTLDALNNALVARERYEAEEAERKAEAERLAKIAAEQKAEADRLAAERRAIEEEKARAEAQKRAEQEAAERKRREEQIAREAAEKAQAEKEAAIREAEERVKREAAEKERQRIEKERIEREEAERKAADKRHRASIKRAAVKELKKVTADAVAVFNAIDAGNVPHVSVGY